MLAGAASHCMTSLGCRGHRRSNLQYCTYSQSGNGWNTNLSSPGNATWYNFVEALGSAQKLGWLLSLTLWILIWGGFSSSTCISHLTRNVGLLVQRVLLTSNHRSCCLCLLMRSLLKTGIKKKKTVDSDTTQLTTGKQKQFHFLFLHPTIPIYYFISPCFSELFSAFFWLFWSASAPPKKPIPCVISNLAFKDWKRLERTPLFWLSWWEICRYDELLLGLNDWKQDRGKDAANAEDALGNLQFV